MLFTGCLGWLAGLLAGLLVTTTAAAQVPSSATLPTDRAGIVAGQVVALRFEDALIHVLQNNQDIEASRLNLRSAELNRLLARGVYDPAFGFDAHYEHRATAVSSILGGTIQSGSHGIEVQVDVESEESPDKIARLVRIAQESCFTHGALAAPVPVETTVRLNGEALELR